MIGIVLRKEIRELLRDRRSLMVMFGIPLVLYPLMIVAFGSLATGRQKELSTTSATLFVENAADAPELLRRLQDTKGITLVNSPPPATAPATSRPTTAPSRTDVVLVVPANAERSLLDNVVPSPKFKIRLDQSKTNAPFIRQRVDTALDEYERWVLEQRLATRNVPAEVLTPLAREVADTSSSEQRVGRILSQLLPLLLMVTGMLGAFFPAMNALTSERELGTLETLLVSPVSRGELLVGKGLLVLACALLTSALNMVSMSAVMLHVLGQAGGPVGNLTVRPATLALAYLAGVPSLILFAALVMIVGMIARTYREANSFAAPVMMIPMASMAIGIAEPATTRALLVTPVANTTVIIRDILIGQWSWNDMALAMGSSLVFAVVVLLAASRVFTNEQLVNPAWEPISLKGFGLTRRGKPRPRRLPTLDEAILLVALTIVIQFYAGPALANQLKTGRLSPVGLLAALMGASFLAPTVLLAIVGRLDIIASFAARAARGIAIGAAVLLGAGLSPIAMAYGELQRRFTAITPSESAGGVAELVGRALSDNLAATIVAFGVIPGICEELVFRGLLLTALRRRFNDPISITVAAVAFAAVHFDAAGFLPRTVLGLLLGWATVRTRSILPAMLLHAAFNSTTIAIAAWLAKSHGAAQLESLTLLDTPGLARLAIGVVLAAVGIWLLNSARTDNTMSPPSP